MKAKKANKFRWKFIAAVYVLSLFYLLFQGGKTALMLFIIFNLLLAYLLLGRWSGIARTLGARTFAHSGGSHNGSLTAGSGLEVNLGIKIPGYYPIPYVIIRDALLRHNGQLLTFETSIVPNWKRMGAARYTTPPLQRGEYRFKDTECLTYDVFGLFEHVGRFHSDAVFSVLPQTVPLRQWSGLQRGIRGPYSHAAAARAAKETTQINGVREYLHGDRLSRIHWNATAKTGQWKSKAFERESLPRTLVILDCHLPSYDSGMQDRFELAVSAAASFVEHGARNGTATGLLTVGERATLLSPKTGIEQRNAVMKHLTFVDADAELPMYASLLQADSLIESGSFAIIVSGGTGSEIVQSMEFLSRKGVTPCLIHIDAPHASVSGNVAWRHMLRGRGWHVYDIRHLQELPTALEGGGIA